MYTFLNRSPCQLRVVLHTSDEMYSSTQKLLPHFEVLFFERMEKISEFYNFLFLSSPPLCALSGFEFCQRR